MERRSKLLESLYNHITLPPKLPSQKDANLRDIEKALTSRLLTAVRTLHDQKNESVAIWRFLERTLDLSSVVNEGGYVNSQKFGQAWTQLQRGEALILQITEQNAGLILRRSGVEDSDSVILEAFESAPSCEKVLESESALLMSFPGTAVSIPFSSFTLRPFQNTLATFLENASLEVVVEFAEKSRKANVSVVESRDPSSPVLISEFLMVLLETHGERIFPPLLEKRVKDEVFWSNAELPWRRSPLWLILRVSLQRLLYLRLGEESGRAHYKAIICLMLAQLLVDCMSVLHPESCNFLKAKIARRLGKLHVERTQAIDVVRDVYDRVLLSIEPFCGHAIQKTITHLEQTWSTFKQQTIRHVPSLPTRASADDLRLSLPNSGQYLQEIFSRPLSGNSQPVIRPQNPSEYMMKIPSEAQAKLTTLYSLHGEIETAVEIDTESTMESLKDCEKLCGTYAGQISYYMSTVRHHYLDCPHQKSIFLLTLLDLWVKMDKCAVKIYPLLKEYHPAFRAHMLDVLLLPRIEDMNRVQGIQQYLDSRCKSSRHHMTIFTDPLPGCFADQYVQKSDDEESLRKLEAEIQQASLQSRQLKEREITSMNAKWTNLGLQLADLNCTKIAGEAYYNCTHCRILKERRKLRLLVHEDFLPRDEMQKRAILFEIGLPEIFAIYRDTTWRILSSFGTPDIEHGESPKILLRSVPQLRRFFSPTQSKFSMASVAKSFLVAHYKAVSLPTTPRVAILPFAMKFSYYDTHSLRWSRNLPKELSFSHHCGIFLPKDSPFSKALTNLKSTAGYGPSSYGVIASQIDCPRDLNIHEFMAYQSLFFGTYTRLPTMLRELGSSNLNLSSLATACLFRQILWQVGPRQGHDPLRQIHAEMQNESFCSKLVEEINRHLDIMSLNWRESLYMDILLTLTTRLCTIGSRNMLPIFERLLIKIRDAMLRWLQTLRLEMRNASETDVADRYARYGYVTSILCRRTFSFQIESHHYMDSQSLRIFTEATLAMQEFLVVDPGTFEPFTTSMFIQDVKDIERMRNIIKQSVLSHPESLESAILSCWPETDVVPRKYSGWMFLNHPYEWWIGATVQETQSTVPQVVQYHILEGHLLIDGKPLGVLPLDIRNAPIMKELFGDQRLQTFSSPLKGMSYMLAISKRSHEIHVGYRNNNIVIRACIHKHVLELLDRSIFHNDLPESLIDGCFHWVDVGSRILDIRRREHMWMYNRSGNWSINLTTRKAHRRFAFLVDPYCDLARKMAKIFSYFEDGQKLTIVQPSGNSLRVEMKRMDLSFSVNREGLLESRELHSEIDPDQDAGTLYGLASKIVVRDTVNRARRSIITPIGSLICQRDGIHVSVTVGNEGTYARYMIDDILGRLHCPPDPRLLYLKAQFHAYTSFTLPDPLTGRTGTEEAIHCLRSGYSQPWTPINPHLIESALLPIAKLTPQRFYYPRHLQVSQEIQWDPELTTTIQHDGYLPVIESIIAKSQSLTRFSGDDEEISFKELTCNSHLRTRGHWRRHIYERCFESIPAPATPVDVIYDSRDRISSSTKTSNVREICRLLRDRPSHIHTTKQLMALLRTWSNIGGFKQNLAFTINESVGFDFPGCWGQLVTLCQSSSSEDTEDLMVQLGLIAYGENVSMEALRVAVAFAVFDDLKCISPPSCVSFRNFHIESGPTPEILQPIAKRYLRERNHARASTPQSSNRALSRKKYEKICQTETALFADFLAPQWPCPEPNAEQFVPRYIKIPIAMKEVRTVWQEHWNNWRLSNFLEKVQKVLDRRYVDCNPVPLTMEALLPRVWVAERLNDVCPRLKEDLMVEDFFGKNSPHQCVTPIENSSFCSGVVTQMPVRFKSEHSRQPEQIDQQLEAAEVVELDTIIDRVVCSPYAVRVDYGRDLQQSLASFKTRQRNPPVTRPLNSTLDEALLKAQTEMENMFNDICFAISRNVSWHHWLRLGQLWPCVTAITLLEQLRSNAETKFGKDMRKAIIAYGVSITKLQHLQRLKDATLRQDLQKLTDETNNPGHLNWSPEDYPDWLLLEVEGNMLIRENQVDVALATIFPQSNANSVLQMNMGQGKTSVIMPMVASVLANGRALSRLIVPKSLLSQTAQILQSRIGGLLGRQVLHVPFSRRTSTEVADIEEYYQLHQNMFNSAGVILAVADHILSFRLSGLQRLSDSRIDEAQNMIGVQRWMDRYCRDVLDESDFTLAVRTQLIYPSGPQLPVDGHPNRWRISEIVLDLVARHVCILEHDYPHSIEVVSRGASTFPAIHFLSDDVESVLVERIINDICSSNTYLLPMWECDSFQGEAIKQFLSQETVGQDVAKCVSSCFPAKRETAKTLLLLRGLLAHRILILCLKKRWNVQYGLHPKRIPMSVPFHAKGVPSEQAEWGHADVAIILTCLSFYFHGITLEQMRQSIRHVLQCDDPSIEYDRWVHSSETLPETLRHWNIINIDDDDQITGIWQHLRFNTVVVNHYLNIFVFPVHAKQFGTKLQASGWDVPQFTPSIDGQQQSLTTGFSGTNDNRRLLPLTIQQQDLPGLRHTNAEVLTYLLQKRNRHYVIAANANGRRLSELELLDKIHSEEIYILIDAGAYILEMDNKSLVRAWLDRAWRREAAVYFGPDNKARVLYRNNKDVPLIASPFAEDMSNCLVYLDEAHTRGTDLKLPREARGALTLGLNQTKDHTVQAAMRLRQLGTSQSVTFVAPPEVNQSILDMSLKTSTALDSSDVVAWLLEQTCKVNKELEQLYLAQGEDFCRRTDAALQFEDLLVSEANQSSYLEVLRQSEQQTLEELYCPLSNNGTVVPADSHSPVLSHYLKTLKLRRDTSHSSSGAILNPAFNEVEQEREVAFEVQQERQTQRPPKFSPFKFPGLHASLRQFISTGRLCAGEGFMKASAMLQNTELGRKHGLSAFSLVSNLYISSQFVRTVILPKNQRNDNFIRPVNWVLWSPVSTTALVIIPEEAQIVIPLLKQTQEPLVHLLVYAAPVAKRMLSFDSLNYYSIPPLENWTAPEWLRNELGLLSGRLYFEFDDYAVLQRMILALDLRDGGLRSRIDQSSQSMLGFLRDWLTIRRFGQDHSQTPMGYLCDGNTLSAEHPFFRARKVESTPPNTILRSQSQDLDENVYDSGDSDDGSTDLN